jgi:hypothetical protein
MPRNGRPAAGVGDRRAAACPTLADASLPTPRLWQASFAIATFQGRTASSAKPGLDSSGHAGLAALAGHPVSARAVARRFERAEGEENE